LLLLILLMYSGEKYTSFGADNYWAHTVCTL
jgi:hypothetical protein